jgi:hypothetical protein
MSELATSLIRGSAYGAIGGSEFVRCSLRTSTLLPASLRSLNEVLHKGQFQCINWLKRHTERCHSACRLAYMAS